MEPAQNTLWASRNRSKPTWAERLKPNTYHLNPLPIFPVTLLAVLSSPPLRRGIACGAHLSPSPPLRRRRPPRARLSSAPCLPQRPPPLRALPSYCVAAARSRPSGSTPRPSRRRVRVCATRRRRARSLTRERGGGVARTYRALRVSRAQFPAGRAQARGESAESAIHTFLREISVG